MPHLVRPGNVPRKTFRDFADAENFPPSEIHHHPDGNRTFERNRSDSAITIAAIVITGITGGVIALPLVCRICRIKHPVAQGVAIGTASHAIGTAKALEMGEIQGAMSSLAIGVAGIITSILIPILLHFLNA